MDNEVKDKNKKEKTSKFDIKEFFMNNKKVIIVSVVILVIVIAAIIIIPNSLGKSNEETQKELLEARIKELAKDFYEIKYYPNLANADGKNKTDDERKDFVKKYESTGITIDLESLARINGDEKENILKEFTNDKTKEACDYQNSKAIIYPKSPFEKGDYEIEAILDCGFEAEVEK